MGKVIKVEDKIYSDLDQLRIGRQTFSDVIRGLLDTRIKAIGLLSTLEAYGGSRHPTRQEHGEEK